MSLPDVPVFRSLAFDQLPERFKLWLSLEHGLSEAHADVLAAVMLDWWNSLSSVFG